jgi:hypothetical protein
MAQLQHGRAWRLNGIKLGKIYRRNKYNSGYKLFPFISRRLYAVKEEMSTKKAYKASSAAGQASVLRASSQSCSSLIQKLNTKS